MKILNTILTICTVLLMASCDYITTTQEILHCHANNTFEVLDAKLYDDNRHVELRLEMSRDLGDIDITDTAQVNVVINDTYSHLVPLIRGEQPRLDSIRYIAPDVIQNTGLVAMVLVDLSQPSPVMKTQMEYVKKLHTLFSRRNLYMAFMMPDGTMSQTMEATDYIINNYISATSPLLSTAENDPVTDIARAAADSLPDMQQKEHALLYRCVSQTLYDMSGHAGTVFDDARKKVLIILSDGQVYDEVTNMPLDPRHYVVQERLINQSRNMPTNTSVFYATLPGTNVSGSVKDNNMMRMLCMQSGGQFISDLDWATFYGDLLHTFNISHEDYIMDITNPEGLIFLGCQRNLNIRMYRKDNGELLAESCVDYCLGSIVNPIIVGDPSYASIYVSGLLIALLIAVLVFAVLQFVVPYVRYRIFRRRYVVQYTGRNMSVGGNLVADTCYFCKAPFQVGDTIVAKCQHTMHEECWYENDQHCPEYGHNCPNGSHYYDKLNIFNPRSGSYCIKWVIPAILASAIAWLIMARSNHDFLYYITDKLRTILTGTKPETAIFTYGDLGPFDATMAVSPRMYLLPLFGLYLVPLLTILFSGLAGYHRPWRYRINDAVARALFVMFVSTILFFAEYIIVYVCDIYDGSALFDWIPWMMVTYLILYVSTVRTRISDLSSRTMLFVSFAMGVTNALLWDVFGTYENKRQITLLIFLYILYGVVLAVTVARNLPPSEKYFLHIRGEVKEMDIALYKWLRQSPDAFVSIGRSVDCQLHISWDATSDIAPVHAIIRMHSGIPYITPADGELFIGSEPLADGKQARLHHGMSFQIGTTEFTYVEA